MSGAPLGVSPTPDNTTDLAAGGVKYDGGKVRLDLLPFDALEELGRVYTMGAAKYADRNWEKGMRWGRVLGAVLRHLFAWARGESRDPESGLSHLAHATWGCLTLLAYELRGVGEDDRAGVVPAAVVNDPPLLLCEECARINAAAKAQRR